MIEIRAIQEKDYPEVARIWRDVLDIPVTDECLAETYAKMGKDDRYVRLVSAKHDEVDFGVAPDVTLLRRDGDEIDLSQFFDLKLIAGYMDEFYKN